MQHNRHLIAAAASMAALLAVSAQAQQIVQGPSSSRTPYLEPAAPNAGVVRYIASITTATDLVPLTGNPALPYEIAGIHDGIGAYDNGDGTVTILCNHEINTNSGVVRRHGARGTLVSEIIVDKNTLQVISGQDLIASFVDFDGTVRNGANGNPIALGRFCSSDLAPVSAFFNSTTGLGTTARIYMNGEEGPSTGYAVATVATGPEKGLAYLLPAFNLSTNGSGVTAVGSWENLLGNPFEQDLTVVANASDGGSNVMNNSVSVYVGLKQAVGNEVEKAGLKNGVLYLVNVPGNPVEIVDSTTRATNITSGMRFNLEPTTSTRFSRPEDGAWDPNNPRDFYFVTTDRIDTSTNTGFNQTIGTSGTVQIGMSRLWRLRFDDIRSPLLGGTIDIVIDGSKNGVKVNMLDNMCVGNDGLIYLTEDPGNNTYLAKTFVYDPITDVLTQLVKVDSARWGELAVNGGTPGAIAPYNNNKEISGVIDVTDMFPHADDETVLLIDVQDHSTNPAVASPASVEGGQLLLMRVAAGARSAAYGTGCGLTLTQALGSRPAIGSVSRSEITGLEVGAPAFMMVGLSNTNFGSDLLPLDLTSVGITGCFLLQDLAVDGGGACVSTGPNSARFSLPLPKTFAGIGFPLYLQALAPNAAANPVGIELSNGLALTVGY